MLVQHQYSLMPQTKVMVCGGSFGESINLPDGDCSHSRTWPQSCCDMFDQSSARHNRPNILSTIHFRRQLFEERS